MVIKCQKCGRDLTDAQAARPDGGEGVCNECQRLSAAEAERNAVPERTQGRFFARENNTVGLVGFILSIVSILPLCNTLSPLALVLSVAGLTRKPRMLAIAGIVISASVTLVNVIAFCAVIFHAP
jgi:hypothetical protein